MVRICTYAKFSFKRNSFWVFNTHFDHRGAKARLESARLILRQINRLNSEKIPVILMGDLNATPDSEPIKLIAENMLDSRMTSDHYYGGETTFNGFKIK